MSCRLSMMFFFLFQCLDTQPNFIIQMSSHSESKSLVSRKLSKAAPLQHSPAVGSAGICFDICDDEEGRGRNSKKSQQREREKFVCEPHALPHESRKNLLNASAKSSPESSKKKVCVFLVLFSLRSDGLYAPSPSAPSSPWTLILLLTDCLSAFSCVFSAPSERSPPVEAVLWTFLRLCCLRVIIQKSSCSTTLTSLHRKKKKKTQQRNKTETILELFAFFSLLLDLLFWLFKFLLF